MQRAIVLILIVMSFISGCQLTPRQQYASALVEVTTVKESLLMLREAKVFDDEEWVKIEPWFSASTEFLDSMESALANGQTDMFTTYHNAILRALFKLQGYDNDAKGVTTWRSLWQP